MFFKCKCTRYQPISVADVGWSINRAQCLISSYAHFFFISIWWLQAGNSPPLAEYALDDESISKLLIACSTHSENRNNFVPIIYIFRPYMVRLLCSLLGPSNPYRSHTVRPVITKMARFVGLSHSDLTETNNKTAFFKI